eukprot:2744430-Lingulodinium_polyedra.AAC.1
MARARVRMARGKPARMACTASSLWSTEANALTQSMYTPATWAPAVCARSPSTARSQAASKAA